jgi:sulfur relay (sulfurtransferase) complex TusBCD TusD component (DsrE family)
VANIGFILNQSPFVGKNVETLYNLAIAALDKKHNVYIFLNQDAVLTPIKNQRHPDSRKSPREYIYDLIVKGANIVCNNLDIRIRGLDSGKAFLDGVKTGGLPDIAETVALMDKIICL